MCLKFNFELKDYFLGDDRCPVRIHGPSDFPPVILSERHNLPSLLTISGWLEYLIRQFLIFQILYFLVYLITGCLFNGTYVTHLNLYLLSSNFYFLIFFALIARVK